MAVPLRSNGPMLSTSAGPAVLMEVPVWLFMAIPVAALMLMPLPDRIVISFGLDNASTGACRVVPVCVTCKTDMRAATCACNVFTCPCRTRICCSRAVTPITDLPAPARPGDAPVPADAPETAAPPAPRDPPPATAPLFVPGIAGDGGTARSTTASSAGAMPAPMVSTVSAILHMIDKLLGFISSSEFSDNRRGCVMHHLRDVRHHL